MINYVLLLLAFALRAQARIRQRPELSNRVLWLSDLHVDIYYGTRDSLGGNCRNDTAPKFGTVGCDSPLILVKETLEAAAEVEPNPAFIIVTGDYLRHEDSETPLAKGKDAVAYHHYIFETIRTITTMIDHTFPDAKKIHIAHSTHTDEMKDELILTLGNNDLESDYNLAITNTAENPWVGELSDFLKGQLTKEQHHTFAHGGYYSGEVLPGLHVISLNTVIYSPAHAMPKYNAKKYGNVTEAEVQQENEDPFGQFDWLNRTLNDIRWERCVVYLTGHITPSFDTWNSKLMWREKYLLRYQSILREYRDVIKAHMYGHVHSSEMRAFPSQDYGEAPFLITGAISPVYQNSPTFSLLAMDPGDYTVIDWGVYATLDVCSEVQRSRVAAGEPPPESLTWTPIFESAVEYFELSQLSNSEFYRYTQTLMKDNNAWKKWLYQYKQGNPTDCFGKCRVEMVCVLSSWHLEDLKVCIDANKL